MKRFIALLAILLLTDISINAQGMTLYDPVTSRTFDSDKYSSMKGSPFLYEKWNAGTATSQRGVYNELELKLDSYANILYYNREDNLYEFLEDIRSFVIFNGDSMYFKKGLSAPSLKPNQYVQVLAEGKMSLYRSEIKQISEMSEINAGMVKTFTTSTRYYVTKDGQTQLIKLNKSDVLGFMKDKETEIKDYIEKNNIGTKKEADLAKIIKYYNSL
jgi:hypothetical protein